MNKIDKKTAEPPVLSVIELFAQRTLDLMPKPVGGPPQDVILVVSVIMLILKLCMLAWQCWENGGKAASICMNPSFIQKWYLKRLVRRVLKERGLEDQTNRVVSALLQMAKAVTPEDIEAIFKEAQSDPETWVAAKRLDLV